MSKKKVAKKRPLFVQIRLRKGKLELFVRCSPEYEEAMKSRSVGEQEITYFRNDVEKSMRLYQFPDEVYDGLEAALPVMTTQRLLAPSASPPRLMLSGTTSVWFLKAVGLSKGLTYTLDEPLAKELLVEVVTHVKKAFLGTWAYLGQSDTIKVTLTVEEGE